MQCTHENIVPINPDYFSGNDRRCCDCRLVSSDGIYWEVWKEKPSGKDAQGGSTQEVEQPAPLMSSLGEANSVINGERQDQYGSPEDSFKIIAGYWNIFLRSKLRFAHPDILTPLDVVNMMVLFKQARKLGQKPNRDNYIDSIGYEAIGADRLWED